LKLAFISVKFNVYNYLATLVLVHLSAPKLLKMYRAEIQTFDYERKCCQLIKGDK